MTNLNQLPQEILHLIMGRFYKSSLFQCALVDKSMYTTATPLLWRSITLRATVQVPRFIKAIQPSTTTLPLGNFIRHLTFTNHTLADHHLDNLMNVMGPQLQHLRITSNATQISNACLQRVAQYWIHLTTLVLEQSPIDRTTIHVIGEHCHQLDTLYLSGCRQLTPDIFPSLVPCRLSGRVLLRYSIGHEYLNKHGHSLEMQTFGGRGAAPMIVNVLTTRGLWRDLTGLVITGSFGIDNEQDTIVGFIESHLALQVVELRNTQVTDLTLDAMVTFLPQVIQRVILTGTRGGGLTAPGIRRLVYHCRSLVMLSFKNCGMTSLDFPELVLASTQRANFVGLGRFKIDAIRQHSRATGKRN